MILVHFLIALSLLVTALVQQIDLLHVFEVGMQFAQTRPWGVYAGIIAGCSVLVLVAVILEQMKSYTLMYLLSKAVFELSLLVVNIFNLFALFFGWNYLKNIWLDLIPLSLLPYLGVVVAMVMVQLFDFNYPFKKRVLSSILLSVTTIVLVAVHIM